MATPIHEKSSRKGVMYVYKLDTGNQPAAAAIKKSGSKGWGGVLRRSKTYRENEQNRGEVIQEARKSVTVIEESRKSVSIVEDSRKLVPPPTNYYEEARKSVSSNVGEITRKLVPPPTNYYEEGRKSVSHVGDTRKLSVPMYEEARKSVSVTEARKSAVARVEMNVASMAALLQVKVMVTDMPGFMQVHAFRCARQTHDSLEKFSAKQMAHNLKKEFDKVYGPAWHCIVGSSFGSFVTHATGGFLYFSIEKMYILIFKTKVQKNLN